MKEDNPMPNVPIPTTTWKRKEIPHNENFRIALVANDYKEDHLHPGIKISFLDIVILVEILDTRQSIAESMKGITTQAT